MCAVGLTRTSLCGGNYECHCDEPDPHERERNRVRLDPVHGRCRRRDDKSDKTSCCRADPTPLIPAFLVLPHPPC